MSVRQSTTVCATVRHTCIPPKTRAPDVTSKAWLEPHIRRSSTCRNLVPTQVALWLAPVNRHAAGVITSLGGEVTDSTEGVDAPEQKLYGSVGSAWCVAWQLVAGELDLVEGQTAFLAPGAQVAGTGEGAAVVLWVIWRVEWCVWV